MFNQNKVKDGLSVRSVLKTKKLRLIWQEVFYTSYEAKNNSPNKQKTFLFAPLKKAITFLGKWLLDCINKEISFGILFSLILVFFSIGIIFLF